MNTQTSSRDRATVLLPGEGRQLTFAASAGITFKAGERESEDAYAISVITVVPNNPGPAMHVHRERDDLTFVTEGTLTYDVEGETIEAPKGAFVLIPRGLAHRWSNLRPEPAVFLNIHVPGLGFERFLSAFAELFADGRRPALTELVECGAGHDVHFDEQQLRALYVD